MLDISEKNVRKNMVLSTVYRALSMVISYLYVPVVFAMLVTPYWSRTSVAKSHDDYNLIKKGIREMQCLWGVGIVGVLVLMIVFKPLAKVWLQKELFFLLKMNMGVVGVLMGTVLSFMVSAIVVPLSVRNEINIHIKKSSEG